MVERTLEVGRVRGGEASMAGRTFGWLCVCGRSESGFRTKRYAKRDAREHRERHEHRIRVWMGGQ